MNINDMREAYNKIERIDPCGDAYRNLIKFLDKQPTRILKDLADAKIKWVSMLARNRVNSRA